MGDVVFVDNFFARRHVVDIIWAIEELLLRALLHLPAEFPTPELDYNASGFIYGLGDLLITKGDIFVCRVVSSRQASNTFQERKCTDLTRAAQMSHRSACAVHR
jgi:hypothetical protein